MGTLSPEEAGEMLKNLPYEDLGYAKLDLHRKLRSGFPETVYCQGNPISIWRIYLTRCTVKMVR